MAKNILLWVPSVLILANVLIAPFVGAYTNNLKQCLQCMTLRKDVSVWDPNYKKIGSTPIRKCHKYLTPTDCSGTLYDYEALKNFVEGLNNPPTDDDGDSGGGDSRRRRRRNVKADLTLPEPLVFLCTTMHMKKGNIKMFAYCQILCSPNAGTNKHGNEVDIPNCNKITDYDPLKVPCTANEPDNDNDNVKSCTKCDTDGCNENEGKNIPSTVAPKGSGGKIPIWSRMSTYTLAMAAFWGWSWRWRSFLQA